MPTDQPTTKGGNIILRRVDTPDRVSPGEGYEIDVTVSNGAAYINPWDPDKCGLAPPGYKINVVIVGPNGERRESGEVCHTTTEIGSREETYSFELVAPETEDYAEVEAHVELVGSGKQTDSVASEFLVDAEESEQPDDPREDPGGDDGGNDDGGSAPWNNPGGSDPSDPLNIGGQMDKLLLVLGLIALAWAADSGAEVIS